MQFIHEYAAQRRFDALHNASHSEESDCDSSLGPQEDIKPFTYVDVVKAKLAATPAKPSTVVTPATQVAAKAFTLEEKLSAFTAVMSFLPLADLEVARSAGPLFAAAAERVAPRPLATKDVVFYRYSPQLEQADGKLHLHHHGMPTHANTHRVGTAAPQPASSQFFQWRCLSCGHLSLGPRNCNSCRAPLTVSACRVFLGQIRKDLSAETASAMVRALAPHVNVLHMESHTNGLDGRGKGCAWAYVDSVDDAVALTQLHKRVFVDLDGDRNEGFWFVEDPALMPRLAAMAEEVSASRFRPQWLPRQPLVAELPAKSMLANVVNGYY